MSFLDADEFIESIERKKFYANHFVTTPLIFLNGK